MVSGAEEAWDVSWKRTVNDRKLSQAVTDSRCCFLGVISLPEQNNTSLGAWHAAIDLGNATSSIPARKDHQNQSRPAELIHVLPQAVSGLQPDVTVFSLRSLRVLH